VGKLLGHGHFLPHNKGQHPRFSVEFVEAFPEVFARVSDAPLLQELVQRHHNDREHFASEFLVQNIEDRHVRTLAALVSKADRLSSSQPGAGFEQWQDYRETALTSILERVNRVDIENPQLRYHVRTLQPPPSLEVTFPDEFPTFGQGELNQHITEFREDFHRLFQNGKIGAVDTTDFECLISYMLNVLYKYAWCIPSNTQEAIPDVSLYDHLKTTAAVASCLYLYHSDTQTLNEHEIGRADIHRFCLVAGDLSEIQKYIFDIATVGTGRGVARRLRSRSFFVQLYAETASHLILSRLGLPIGVHTIINSGGRFYLLLPNLPQVKTILDEAARSVDT